MDDPVQSGKPDVIAPDAGKDRPSALVAGNNAFAFDLYQALRGQDDRPRNLFCSPYSISIALAMTYAGARGETEGQMADVLHFALSQADLHPAFNALDRELDRRGESASQQVGDPFRLHVVNAIWGQADHAFLPAYLDLLAENYGGGPRLLDFAEDPEASRLTVNDWVAEQTEGKVGDLVPPGAIDKRTRLLLTNAIYFSASWKMPFMRTYTQEGPFHTLDGRQVIVPMMRQQEHLRYAAGTGYQAVELPYVGDQLSMLILLPAEGQFDAFARGLDAAQMDLIVRDLVEKGVQLSMPRFSFASASRLKDTLTAMGMRDAFTSAADFSGMDGTHELAVSDVLHNAFVAVDEAGTEAAAATAVGMQLLSAPRIQIEVTVDRPFIFAIRDTLTGTTLFLGQVVDPGA